MVALPTPALAATASMERLSTLMPSLSRAITACRMASSARALRGRPGALRSWSAPDLTLGVVMASIVTGPSRLYQLDALLFRQALGPGRRRCGRPLARQPDQRDQRAQHREHGRPDRGVVHRGHERVVRLL